jgi:hypothetical protein
VSTGLPGRRDVNRCALAGRIDFERRTARGRPRASPHQESVELLVAALRVVVEQHELPRPGGGGNVDCVLHRAVAPTNLRAVLVRFVLGVVHHDVRAGEEGHMAGRRLRRPAAADPVVHPAKPVAVRRTTAPLDLTCARPLALRADRYQWLAFVPLLIVANAQSLAVPRAIAALERALAVEFGHGLGLPGLPPEAWRFADS